jgi:xylulokinase
VSTLNAAKVTDTFARLPGVDHDQFARLALAAEPAGTPIPAAFLDGERKPNLPAATGSLTRLTTAKGVDPAVLPARRVLRTDRIQRGD